MLEKLHRILAGLLAGTDYHSRLEQYIATRHPKSAADVELLERQYYQEQHRGWI